ncbi:MAG: S9 family peptidase [Bacteroidota bacterium]|nr:S9 family peptidase [Bacteroidota bacterium]
MSHRLLYLKIISCLLGFVTSLSASAQLWDGLNWSKDGNRFYVSDQGAIIEYNLENRTQQVLVSSKKLIPAGKTESLEIKYFFFSSDDKKVLLFTNTKKVWRYETRGDYWVYNISDSTLQQLGKSLPVSSLMFAKFSPDGTKAAYVSGHNIYVEDLNSHLIKPLTRNGSRKMINGTFDWVYEEEFNCRDGFRWSPDSKAIAFWQINDSSTRDYYMLNTTDSVYSRVIPVEYPVAGQLPSPFKIGVVQIKRNQTTWMKIPADKKNGTYLPRMEWAANSQELIVQRINRNQNESELIICNAKTGAVKPIYKEVDQAWIDVLSEWDESYKMGGWDWFKNGSEFLWASEKDGWRHLYRVSRDGKNEVLITRGNYDVMAISLVDEKNNLVYFMASPDNATQAYLYRCPLDGRGPAQRVTPAGEPGTHIYELSPNGKFASHRFSNYYTATDGEWITLPDHLPLKGSQPVKPVSPVDSAASNISFFKIKTSEGISMDGWMQKPIPFDSTKKYPVLFFVYTEPGSQTVKDEYGATVCPVYTGDLARDGYIYISLDNRGTPVPKGASWRKSIYRKIGLVNINDQAQAAAEICRWPFVDTSRIAVWGWSGGGSATLNLMFQHPEIYKTGLAIAALGNLETYDNIYQERYMGNPLETKADYIRGSPITYASKLQGNLLYVHGSGDDNVHFGNAEMLVNELVKYNKTFQFMEYPNRTHALDEGPGTTEHLHNLFKNYLNAHCPGGAK